MSYGMEQSRACIPRLPQVARQRLGRTADRPEGVRRFARAKERGGAPAASFIGFAIITCT